MQLTFFWTLSIIYFYLKLFGVLHFVLKAAMAYFMFGLYDLPSAVLIGPN
jgi:hypothetical protein